MAHCPSPNSTCYVMLMVRVGAVFRFGLVKNRSVGISFVPVDKTDIKGRTGVATARVRAARDLSDIVPQENKQSNNWRLFSAVLLPPPVSCGEALQ